MPSRERYERFLRDRHRPSHARRTAASHAAFLLPHLAPGMRVLDLGCGPASITVGLGDHAIGVDIAPGPAEVPLASADVYRLPFPAASFDAVFSCAVLQHLTDPPTALAEARRVCRQGAVIGIADADLRSGLHHPHDPLFDRGQEILERLRGPTLPDVGRRLRGLLHDAGFARCSVQPKAIGGGDGRSTPMQASFQASAFESPQTIAVVVEEGIAAAEEMSAIAQAWRRFGDDPAAVSTGIWFEAVAWAD